jgi:hypothetical protein
MLLIGVLLVFFGEIIVAGGGGDGKQEPQHFIVAFGVVVDDAEQTLGNASVNGSPSLRRNAHQVEDITIGTDKSDAWVFGGGDGLGDLQRLNHGCDVGLVIHGLVGWWLVSK